MFVLPGAREQVLRARREALADKFIRPLLDEARALRLSDDELTRLIDQERNRRP